LTTNIVVCYYTAGIFKTALYALIAIPVKCLLLPV
jgi:hypothetical protein